MNDMDFHELLLNRHSIRRYTGQPISAEDVKLIIEAALTAPTSKSKRPWNFVAVEDRDTLQKLSAFKPRYQTSVAGATLAVVITADPEESDMFAEDCAIAAVFMQLQAEALGIGSCWVQVRGRYAQDDEPSENVVRDLLGVPYSQVVECVVTFGYSAETRRPQDPEKFRWDKVHIGTWRAE